MSKLVNAKSSAGWTTTTVHVTMRDGSHARLCRPNANAMLDHRVGTWHVAVTCGNCLRVIAATERLAHQLNDEMDAGTVEAERHHAWEIRSDGYREAFPAALAQLRRAMPDRSASVAYWIHEGNVRAAGNAAYGRRLAELELAYLEQLAAQAELEAYATQRSMDRAERDAANDPLVSLIKAPSVPMTAGPNPVPVHELVNAETPWEQLSAFISMGEN